MRSLQPLQPFSGITTAAIPFDVRRPFPRWQAHLVPQDVVLLVPLFTVTIPAGMLAIAGFFEPLHLTECRDRSRGDPIAARWAYGCALRRHGCHPVGCGGR